MKKADTEYVKGRKYQHQSHQKFLSQASNGVRRKSNLTGRNLEKGWAIEEPSLELFKDQLLTLSPVSVFSFGTTGSPESI